MKIKWDLKSHIKFSGKVGHSLYRDKDSTVQRKENEVFKSIEEFADFYKKEL
jgi:hypothetical protein